MKQPFVHNKQLFLVSQAGCLLPLLFIFNLFFGWMFFKPSLWLLISFGFVVLFVINSYIFARKLGSSGQKRDNIIDVEGSVEK
ncbi:MAG: hypothetical protein HZC15_06755 [Candidatus Omnitrophica bacterium]|jgi:hypothetical protein|nr:hypothetical protein [Candidatus Omnitrophota bacterium]